MNVGGLQTIGGLYGSMYTQSTHRRPQRGTGGQQRQPPGFRDTHEKIGLPLTSARAGDAEV